MEKIKRFILLFVICLLVTSCSKKEAHLTKIKAQLISIDSLSAEKQDIVKIVKPYKEKMNAEIHRIISFAPENLVVSDGNLQSSLGNLLADLSFDIADSLFFTFEGKHADFALFNHGGIRAEINKGKVTNKHVFEIMPFDNTLVVAELSHEKIMELFNFFLNGRRAHPISDELQIVLSKKGNELFVKGKKLNKNKTYFVVTSDYLQSGGDNMIFFKNPLSLFESNFLVRDAIRLHFESKDTLRGKLDNRVLIKS